MVSALKSWLKRRGIGRLFPVDYRADGVAVTGKNLAALSESAFERAYAKAERLNAEGWPDGVPDIRWRAHVCCWAATQALSIAGDFVECGVHTGLLSVTVAEYVDFATVDRRFWLMDTFAGIPVERVSHDEKAHVEKLNSDLYFDCYELARRNFAPYPNARLVRGILPESFAQTEIEAVAYLSIDLNNSDAEMAVIERLWPKLSHGAIVVLDDYAFAGYESQHQAWDGFARKQGLMVLTVPTGQGILIKP